MLIPGRESWKKIKTLFISSYCIFRKGNHSKRSLKDFKYSQTFFCKNEYFDIGLRLFIKCKVKNESRKWMYCTVWNSTFVSNSIAEATVSYWYCSDMGLHPLWKWETWNFLQWKYYSYSMWLNPYPNLHFL